MEAEYHNDWQTYPELTWYKSILNTSGNTLPEANEDGDLETECDCLIEDSPVLKQKRTNPSFYCKSGQIHFGSVNNLEDT